MPPGRCLGFAPPTALLRAETKSDSMFEPKALRCGASVTHGHWRWSKILVIPCTFGIENGSWIVIGLPGHGLSWF